MKFITAYNCLRKISVWCVGGVGRWSGIVVRGQCMKGVERRSWRGGLCGWSMEGERGRRAWWGRRLSNDFIYVLCVYQ